MQPRILITRTISDTLVQALREGFDVDDSQERDGPHPEAELRRRQRPAQDA